MNNPTKLKDVKITVLKIGCWSVQRIYSNVITVLAKYQEIINYVRISSYPDYRQLILTEDLQIWP